MSEELNQEQTQQEPIIVGLTLNIEQINFILGALGKLPTETGAWLVRQIVVDQVNPQLESMQSVEEETTTE